MKGKLSDGARLMHIKDCILEIEEAISNKNEKSFLENHVLRIAVVKWIEIIGEASVYLSDELKKENNGIDWPAIKGLRNIVVHEYFGINFELIWEVASEHVPLLKQQILKILKEFN